MPRLMSGRLRQMKLKLLRIRTVGRLVAIFPLLIQQCNPDTLSAEDNNYSDELLPMKRVFCLSVNSNEDFSTSNTTKSIGINEITPPNQLLNGSKELPLNSNSTKSIFNLAENSEEIKNDSEKFEDYETEDNENESLGVPRISELDSGVPSPTSVINPEDIQEGDAAMEGKSPVTFLHPIVKNIQREFETPAASHIHASHDQIEEHKKLTRQKIKKHRKRPMIGDIPPISSLKPPRPASTPRPDHNIHNLFMESSFLSPGKEESSSSKLKQNVNERLGNADHKTKIQIINPENDCIILGKNKKKTLLNVWSFSNEKLKLESQRELPPSIFNITNALDGELLNQDEIPQPVSNVLTSILTGIGRSGNVTALNNIHIPASSESFFGGESRRNVIMLHYILWGHTETAWKTMLDKTVENYLRNYFLSAYRRRSSKSLKQINWRKMRNVLLNFMESPDATNCTQSLQTNDIIQKEQFLPNRFYNLTPSPLSRPLSLRHPNKRPLVEHSTNRPLTRDEGGVYGWQDNTHGGMEGHGGWGVQKVQEGWGSPQGWGWDADQGKKKKKKKKKKKGKKGKKGKKKKKGKKGKKKKKGKKGKKGGWGGWDDSMEYGHHGWGPKTVPDFGPIKWSSFEINPGELLQKTLAVIGLFGLPIAIFLATCLLVYLASQKHGYGRGAGPYFHTSFHKPSAPHVFFSEFPRTGWRRITEKPSYYYDDFYDAASTINPIPKPWMYRVYYNSSTPSASSSSTLKDKEITKSSYRTESLKTEPLTFSDDVKKPSSFRSKHKSDLYSKKNYRKSKYREDPNYDDYNDEIDFIYDHYQPITTRTKQEEDLIKILSKHKKNRLEKLLKKWKLENRDRHW